MYTSQELEDLIDALNDLIYKTGTMLRTHDSGTPSDEYYISGVPTAIIRSMYTALVNCKDITKYTKKLIDALESDQDEEVEE